MNQTPTPASDPAGDIPNPFDVLVVGSGAAGLYASLCLPSHLRVGLVTKDNLESGSSPWAQGGIAAAIYPPDTPNLHLEDTLKAGAGLCDREAVQFLVDHAAEAIAFLVNMGVDFDRKGEKLATTLEAAHSFPRVLHSRDTTGRAIVDVLMATVLERPNIQVISQAIALSLWLHPETGRCQGISLLCDNQIRWMRAKAVVLATGGGGQVFAKTTNPEVSTGDGIAIAWRAGAAVRDLEFVQFHPTALMKPGAPHFLISEAVRGEGAHLVDREGRRFAFDYHPSGELAPRDVVSRAIYLHLQNTAENPAEANVYLDMRPIAADKIRRRFPNIIQVCQHWGIDVFNELMPVAPAAHYWMGGVACDVMNRTSISGLYAIGETASTGVHGANRLASNSLLECLVFASQLSKIESDLNKEMNGTAEPSPETVEIDDRPVPSGDPRQRTHRIASLRQDLAALMWDSAGICRTREVLEAAIATVEGWRKEVENLEISRYLLAPNPQKTVRFTSPETGKYLKSVAELLNLLDIAHLILKSAAFRTESRGGHYRLDYPETREDWQVHTVVKGDRCTSVPTGMRYQEEMIRS
ncbi:MAG: L-aspartate oxidase [Limnospira sp.]